MAKQSSKRYAGTRNALPNAQDNRQAESDNADSTGNGQVGGIGLEKSRNNGTESQKISFNEMVALIVDHNACYRTDLVSRAWFPEASESQWIGTNCADVPVLDGDAGYTLTTGERINL